MPQGLSVAYLQRWCTPPFRLQSEAERLLAGARDLEESIGVSLSARRFEVRCVRCGCAVVAGPHSQCLPV